MENYSAGVLALVKDSHREGSKGALLVETRDVGWFGGRLRRWILDAGKGFLEAGCSSTGPLFFR